MMQHFFGAKFLFGSDFIPIPGNGSGLQLKTGNGNERKLLQNEKVKPENQFSKKNYFCQIL